MREAPRDLRLLAGAVFLSAAGDFLALITLALLVHELTASPFAVAALFATTMVPAVLLAPLAGLVADRVESSRVLIVASLAQAAVACGLAFTTDMAALLALASVLAAGSAISQPAEFALVPAAAGRRLLTEANGLMEAARYAGFAAGPLLAAVMAGAGAQLVLLVNAASFLAIAAAARAMQARREPQRSADGETDRARDGVVFLVRDPVLRVSVGAATLALLFISASMTVEVFYLKDVVKAGDAGYALATAVWMAGMVVGATGLAHRVPRRAIAAGALAALAIQGAGMAFQTVWPILPVALGGYLVGGLGHGVKNTLMRTVIALRVPGRVHGRAFAAYNAARNSAELAALGAGGVIVAAIGARPALLIAGLGPVVAGLAGMALLRRPSPRRSAAQPAAVRA